MSWGVATQNGVSVSLASIVSLSCGATEFSPASFFASGENGVWYDPSDISTLFQDSGGTNPVTAAGQTVVLMKDKSGNAHHATLTNCTYQITPAGRPYIACNSGGTSSGTTSSFAMGSDKVTVWAAFQQFANSSKSLVSFGNISTQTGTFDFGVFGGTSGMLMYRRGSGSFGGRAQSTAVGSSETVACCQLNLAGTTQDTECPDLRVNLTQPTLNNYGTADSGGGNFGTYALSLFTGQGVWTGYLFELIIRTGVSTTNDISNGENYCVTKCGPPLTYSLTPTNFSDTGTAANQGTYYLTSTFASVDLTTTATEIQVGFVDTCSATFPNEAGIGVYCNGVWMMNLIKNASNYNFTRVPLPSGSNNVKIVNGLESKPSSTIIGTWTTTVNANASLTQQILAGTNRILVYGDSIAAGSAGTPAVRYGWAPLLRASYAPKSLAVEAWGYRALYNDCSTAGAITTFTSVMSAYSPSFIWLAIGTNDYGLALWTAAAFGAAYGSMLDSLNAALPGVPIYCQTPIVRQNENTANSLGNNLPAYRTAISNAVSSRTSFATLVDGTAILTLSDLSDGIHPSVSGHAKYKAYVQTYLGI